MVLLFFMLGVSVVVGGICIVTGVIWVRQYVRFLAKAHYDNGVSSLQKDAYAQAEREFQAALRRQKNMPEARYGLAMAFIKQQRYHEGIQLLEALIQAMPSNATAHYNLGLAYLETGELDKAQHLLEKAAHIDPTGKEIYFNLSKILEQKGDIEHAKEQCANALKVDKNYAKAQEFLDYLSGIRYFSPISLDLIRKALRNFDQNNTEFMIKL